MAVMTIHTQVLMEQVLEEPEATRAAGIPGVPVFEMMGGALFSQAARVDASGRTHHAFATGLVTNNNITYVEYRIVPPHPGPYPVQPFARIEPSQKIDTVTMDRSGEDVLIYLTTHDLAPGPRRLRVELAVIPGVWHTSPGFEAEEGGAGAYQGVALPEVEVDPEEILQAMAAALNNRDHALAGAMSKQIKNNAQIGAANALNESYRDTEGSFYKGFGPFKRFADTVWEQVHKVMRERGVGQDPPPPPQPEEEG